MSDRNKGSAVSADKTRRLLFITLGVVAAALFAAKVVWPRMIAPWADLSGKIASKTQEQTSLERQLLEGDVLRKKYEEFVHRSGGTNINQVRDELPRQLTKLLDDTHLTNVRVGMQEPKTDRKTKITTLSYSINAQGGLPHVVEFLRQFYELPFVVRFNDLHLQPIVTPGKNKAGDQVSINGSVEALLLPERSDIKVRPGTPAEATPRHRNADYGLIALKSPFSEYVAPPPPTPEPQGACCVANADGTFSCSFVTQAQCAASGGSYKGDGTRCQPDPCNPKPLEIVERHEPAPAVDLTRPFKLVSATLSYGVDEVRINNTQTQQHEYVAVGRDLDGGKLVLVHPLGAVVHKEDGEDYVYPLGKTFVESVRLNEAREYPEIIVARRRQMKFVTPAVTEQKTAAAIEGNLTETSEPHAAAGAPEPAPVAEEGVEDWEPPRLILGPLGPLPELDQDDFVGPPYVPSEAPAGEPGVSATP
ncbi:MAG TPA: hypothetical protein VGM03_18345 [Phycisphaerae bacterium]|jgi:hypothetical protein